MNEPPTHDRAIRLDPEQLAAQVPETGRRVDDVLARDPAQERLRTQYMVSRILAESTTVRQASMRILASICGQLGWQMGALWTLDRENDVLRCAEVHVSAPAARFESVTRERTFTRGSGLPGRVWASGEAAWIPDVVQDTNFPRAPVAAADDLHGAFGIPVVLHGDVIGVLEFFSHEIRERDDDVLQMMTAIGSQIGQFVERRRAEEALRIRVRQQDAAARLGEVALRERDLQMVLDHATQAVRETLDVEYTKVLELLPGGEALLLRSGVGWREGLVGHATVGAGIESQAGYTLLSDMPVVVPDLSKETRFSGPPLLLEHGVVSGMSCIIRGAAGLPWGVFGAHTSRLRTFTGDDVNFLTTVANTLADAIHRRNSEEALREASRRKDEFLATLAHELRNPLAPLRSGLEVMKRAKDDPAAIADARTMMERQLGHMVRLIDDLLDIGRISRGRITLRPERIELGATIEQAVETSRPFIDAGNHSLTVVCADQLTVDADVTRLAQVFANLLHNAARFTPRGGRIRLTAEREGHEAVVRVRDDGIGIPAEMLPRIFDMFTHVDRGPAGAEAGLGIGLSLVKALVEMHGGAVSAHSEGNGRGSEFVVRLPVVAPAAPTPSPVASPEMRAAPSRRVLVVDDNPDAASSLALLLQIMGSETRTSHDGADALTVADSFAPEIILLDIGMPGMNGYEVARRIREQPWGREVMLVALTGWGQESDRRRSREAGFDVHLVKPVEPARLEELLAQPRVSDTAT